MSEKQMMAMTKEQLIKHLMDVQEQNEDMKDEINQRKACSKNARVRYQDQDKLLEAYKKENEELKEENEKLQRVAKAWIIISRGTDWENIRDLCDAEMCKELIKTGECDEQDFEGYEEYESEQ
jgi:hypothetical protein